MAYTRERLALLQQVPLATLSEDQRQMRADILDDQPQFLHWVTWMKTGQEAEFQQWLVGYRKRRLSPDSLMGVAAPRVTGTYWFNTPQGGPPLVPVPGKVNLLIFINDPEQVATSVDVTALRHLQRDIPGLQIILITKTMGSLMGRSVVDHPDQEAAMIHTFFADSLGLPGILSVDSGTFQKLPTGQIQRNTSANQDRYFQVRVDAGSISSHILVDTRGRVVYETADENDQLAWIIRHLQAMAPGTAAASRAP